MRILLMLLIFEGLAGGLQSPEESRKGLSLARASAPLKNAGIPLDEASLIATLRSENKRLATSAAFTLGILGKGDAPKKALYGVIDDQDQILAVSAMYSLWLLGDKEWTEAGEKRLPTLGDREQILLAGHLARAGNAAGWPSLLKAIKDEKWAALALETVPAFVGKRNSKGETIDVICDLDELKKNLSPSVSAMVEERLKSIKEKDASPPTPQPRK